MLHTPILKIKRSVIHEVRQSISPQVTQCIFERIEAIKHAANRITISEYFYYINISKFLWFILSCYTFETDSNRIIKWKFILFHI